MFKGKARSPIKVVILSFITLGIYMFYWFYMVSKEIKYYMEDFRINPVLDLVLSIVLIFPYSIFWFYKYGRFMADAQVKAGISSRNNGILYAVLAGLGLFFVNIYMMQSDLNQLWENTLE